MKKRRIVAPLAVCAAVASGGVAGALIGIPAISDAQETTTPAPAPGAAPDGHRGPGPVAAAAEALGMDVNDLKTELVGGKTIADVAQEQGVDVDTVIDAMVADALEKVDRAEGEVRQKVTALVNDGLPKPPGPPGPPKPHGPGHKNLEAAAEELGISVDDLMAQLHDGKSVADVADEQGVDVEKVVDAMVAEARKHIEDFVNDGLPKPPGPGDTPPDAPAPDAPDAEGSSTTS